MTDPDPDPAAAGTVLVVGATGTVGGEVVRQLVPLGTAVRAGARDPHRAAAVLPSGVSVVRLDVEDPASWPAALDGVDRMFFLRPPEVARIPRLTPFLDAAAAAGVRGVVVLSVQGADRNPLLPHRALERYFERSAFSWTFLRPGYFMQNLLTVHRSEIRDRRELFIPAGNGRTGFVDVRDIAAVAVLALTQPGHEFQAYELTGPQALTYGEVTATLSAVLGRPIVYSRPGLIEYLRGQLRRGQPRALVLITMVLYTVARLGLAGRLTTTVQTLLGRPPTNLTTFVRDNADAWRTDPVDPSR